MSKIITLQRSGKDHLLYIKKRAVALWEKRGTPPGQFRNCIKEALEEHVKRLGEHMPIPTRCSYCGQKMNAEEIDRFEEYCLHCWNTHILKA